MCYIFGSTYVGCDAISHLVNGKTMHSGTETIVYGTPFAV